MDFRLLTIFIFRLIYISFRFMISTALTDLFRKFPAQSS